MDSMLGIICGGLAILSFLGIGVAVLIWGIRNRNKAEASNTWSSVEGVITSAQIDEDTDVDEDGFSSTTYTPQWQYQYTVNGNSYTGERISFGAVRGYGRLKKAQEELDKYPVNSSVRVYYDPEIPEESVLVQGTGGTWLGIFLGGFFILLAVIGCIVSFFVVLLNM